MFTRRQCLHALGCSAAAAALPPSLTGQTASSLHALPPQFAALEHSSGGRLGVAVLDTETGVLVGHRTEERFAMCSTCKVLLAAAVLRQEDWGQVRLEHLVSIPSTPLVSHSPLTEPHAGGRMSVRDLCHAILTQSDNTAANVLLSMLGGPAAVTRFARSIGDPVTRLDRTETSLNEAAPGDPRDTTSPSAAAADLQRLLLGKVLKPASRDLLRSWMVENQYGLERLRANLPSAWQAADKTGSNGETTGNDIAVYWPTRHAPIVLTAYLTECPGTDAHRGEVLASVGRLVREAFRSS